VKQARQIDAIRKRHAYGATDNIGGGAESARDKSHWHAIVLGALKRDSLVLETALAAEVLFSHDRAAGQHLLHFVPRVAAPLQDLRRMLS
jgi:hypothetical protein